MRELAAGVLEPEPGGRAAAGTAAEEELLTINFGPHHPATHGVLRLLVTLRGEEVLDAHPYIGYVHTGIEKTCEDKSYWKVIPLVERMDYLAYYFNAMAFCMAVERLLDEEVPARAQYLRVIHCELNRIHSHLVWLGTSALDLGAISIFWYCFRERDKVLDLFEYSSGQRMHTRYIQVGGVVEDIPPAGPRRRCASPRTWRSASASTRRSWTATRSSCSAPRTSASSPGAAARARRDRPAAARAGNPWDLRKAAPYSSYDQFDFKIPVGTVGDCYDRYRVRVAEIRESCAIIRQAIEGLPEGPYITTNRKVALPPRHELATSMEALIHHFKLVTEGFRVPPGEAYVPIEGPRGELGCFVVADGSAKPAACTCATPRS